ncbi:YaaR family protein [Virgibacillus sp. W0430]|uniref:YaaR family protein n=1 Tax=Virgibacillus sp. W0430 TaxID=3391580 RepID=UPI003F448CF3
MKISQELRAQMETKQPRSFTDSKQSFDTIVQSQTYKLKQEELQQLVKDITVQGDKLARFRSFRDLAKFKRMVKNYLQEAVSNGLHLEQAHHFTMEGQTKMALVKEIDQKLMELTEEVMNQEKKTVDLLGMIGEIKGLLINIYM